MLPSISTSNDSQIDADEALIQSAITGNVRAFETLYRAYGNRIFWLCHRLCGDRNQAEEMTQETFIKAWQGLSGFRFDSQFVSWLSTIARRLCIDEFRRKNAQVWLGAERFEESQMEPPKAISPEDWLGLEKLVLGLPEGARQVLVLHDIEGLTHAEISNLCGIAEGTSKAQLARARKLVKQQLVLSDSVTERN